MLRTHKSRSVVKFDLGFESKTVVALTLSSLWNVFLSLLDRAEPLLRTLGWNTFACNSLHASFAVCGSSVKQVSHSWHIVLVTDTLYTYLNFITQFISLLNLHLEPELIIVNIDFENLHSVSRSLEIHNCALTSSW